MSYVDTLHPEHEDCPFVAKTTCINKGRIAKYIAGVFFGILSVFLTLVVYASGQARDANKQYTQMTTTISDHRHDVQKAVLGIASAFNEHKAEKSAVDRSIVEKLDEVKIELALQRKEQRVLLEKILDIQLKIAGYIAPSSSAK